MAAQGRIEGEPIRDASDGATARPRLQGIKLSHDGKVESRMPRSAGNSPHRWSFHCNTRPPSLVSELLGEPHDLLERPLDVPRRRRIRQPGIAIVAERRAGYERHARLGNQARAELRP